MKTGLGSPKDYSDWNTTNFCPLSPAAAADVYIACFHVLTFTTTSPVPRSTHLF